MAADSAIFASDRSTKLRRLPPDYAFVRSFSPTPLHSATGPDGRRWKCRDLRPLQGHHRQPIRSLLLHCVTRSENRTKAQLEFCTPRSEFLVGDPAHASIQDQVSSIGILHSAFNPHPPISNSLRSGNGMRDRRSATTRLRVWALRLAVPLSKISAVIFNARPVPAPGGFPR